MTLDEFLAHIKSMYGNWKGSDAKKNIVGNIEKSVIAYIKHDLRLDRLNNLKRYIFYYHPTNYGAPDISCIESAIDKAIKNNKGDDVRLVKKYSTVLKVRPLTDAEKLENEKILAEHNKGLLGMLQDLQAKKKEWKNKEEVVF